MSFHDSNPFSFENNFHVGIINIPILYMGNPDLEKKFPDGHKDSDRVLIPRVLS